MTPPRSLSPEGRLVFRSADPSCPREEVAALAAAVHDWQRVLIIAERELATTGLARALRGTTANVPESVTEHLRKSAMVTELRMQYLSRRLQRTVSVLVERKVPVLLLKGAAVGALSDPTFCARPMNDVDVLVHRADVPRAREAVIDSGWPLTTDPVLLELLADAHHLPHFIDPQMPGIRLELHVALMPEDQPFAFDEAALWRNARPAPAPFAGALVPSPEHLLLHACIHFAWQHTMQFGAWRTVRVLTTAVSVPGFDWDLFVAAAREAKALTSCYWTLRLAERLSGISAPASVMERLAPPTPAWVGHALERHFIAAIAVGESPANPSVRFTRWLWIAALRPGWSGHRDVGRLDPENRWARAYGRASTETFPQQVARHLGAYRRWTSFVRKTLFG